MTQLLRRDVDNLKLALDLHLDASRDMVRLITRLDERIEKLEEFVEILLNERRESQK